MEEGKVAVRERSRGDIGAMSLEEFRELALRLVRTRSLVNE
jgi:threonyl-tRNA synthetase